jgi:hypothetical protein
MPLLVALAVLLAGGIAAAVVLLGRSRVPAAPVVTAPPPPSADEIRRELADLLGGVVGRVPPDVLTKYESIHRRMLAMLPRLGRLEGTSQDLYIVHRTAGDYLPTAVRSYLALVAAGTAEQALPDGRTPHQAVLEQLDLIDTGLAEIADALDRSDIDRLLVHGRFLESRFGSSGMRPGA